MQNNVGIYASQISGHLWAPNGAYDALATVTVPSGGISEVVFAGIPQGYRNLQIRFFGKSNRVDLNEAVGIRFNGDTANNYGGHVLYGDGSGTSSQQVNYPASAISLFLIAGNSSSNTQGAAIIDILDYQSKTKTKTVRSFNGYENNGNGIIALSSGLWNSTAAVNTVTIKPFYGSLWNQYTSIALYGVK